MSTIYEKERNNNNLTIVLTSRLEQPNEEVETWRMFAFEHSQVAQISL